MGKGGLGRHLVDHGYSGPFGLDGLVDADGIAYASESNIRRTATTTPTPWSPG
ncbi:hypothetical protein [Streptomyces sp. CG 926]|uniref:hypothetical protein n=1 Tax=Streptomyces sp. CG 926 TaxID=1882405 RepID=UPI0015E7E96C|nr:hypothetical protein [Streptomyces sp. CG 926]